MRYPDLFADLIPARAKPRVLMHVTDAYAYGECTRGEAAKQICKMSCKKCRAVTDWLKFTNISEAKRGIPCETCNKIEISD